MQAFVPDIVEDGDDAICATNHDEVLADGHRERVAQLQPAMPCRAVP